MARGLAAWMVIGTLSLMATLGRTQAAEEPPKRQEVRVDAFVNLDRGTSVEGVRRTLGSLGRHQFAASISDMEYLGTYFLFDEPRVGFYMIFANGRLKAVVDPPRPEFEKVPYRGSFREVPKPVEAEARLQSILSLKDLTAGELRERIAKAIPAGQGSLGALPAFLIASPIFALKSGDIAVDYQTNRELAERYDPFRVKLGTSMSGAAEMMGQPARRLREKENTESQVFGDARPLRINPAERFSWVTVRFEQGRAVRVFSNHFFDKRLLAERSPQ